MSITLTQVGDQFELAVVNSVLPALTLTAETTRDFAKALMSDDARSPAWQVDKHVWSPTDRNISLGIWVAPGGQLSVYVTGQNVELTDVERQTLAEQVLLTATEYPVGTEIQPIDSIIVHTNGDGTPNGNSGYGRDTLGTISRVLLGTSGEVLHEIVWPNTGFSLVSANLFRKADPIQDWIVYDSGRLYPHREAIVKARTAEEARKMAGPFIEKAKWQGVSAKAVESDGDYDVELASDRVDMSDVAVDPGTGKITSGLGKITTKALAGDARAILVLKAHLGL